MDGEFDQAWQALQAIEKHITTHRRLTADRRRFATLVVERVKTEVALLGQILAGKAEGRSTRPAPRKRRRTGGMYRLHRR